MPTPLRLIASILALGACTSLSHAAAPLAWPETRLETKPWTRWWWLGGIADAKSLTSEMEKYAAAGLGGLEITPIYGVRGEEARFKNFLSPEWVANFKHTLKEGRRLGLGIDLATGTGWPFGGPWLDETDVAHYLAHILYTVPAGQGLAEPVTFTQQPLLRFAGPKRVPIAELKQPVTANDNLQELAIDQVRFERPLPLVALMAYPAKGPALDLTAKVGADGKLDWTAPTDRGEWKLYALFQGQHGKMVERAAPGGEGYALDHLSSAALAHYLKKFDDAFAGAADKGLRGYFNDSYEVDDAQGESDFSPVFLEEFKQRRGYDLRQHLPELFAAPSAGKPARVLSDYRETVSDLLLDEFTKSWRQWARARGAIIRNQAHGSPANILDLYAASDIPEQEGTDLLAIKLASSAAHVTDKPLASAEAATWLDEHFLSTFAELKFNIDTYLLAGINHVCYHGTAFSPPDEPWPGFQFYASVELNPQNPLWTDFPAFNAYVTRVQSFLQNGRPDEDVLLYYNIHDRWAQRGNGAMPHFHGGERDGVGARAVAAELHDAGVGFDYISDRQIQQLSSDGKLITSGRAGYRAIVVPPTRFMPAATLQKLAELAEAGATVYFLKQIPEDAPGLNQRHQEYAALRTRVLAVKATVAGDLTALAANAGIPHETMRALGLEFVRRRTNDGFHYFVVNRGSKAIDAWVPLGTAAACAARFDPMSGAGGLAAFRHIGRGNEVYLQLEPGESCIVRTFAKEINGPPWTYWQNSGAAQPLAGEWSVQFVRGGPELPPAARLSELKSWTDFGGDAGRSFSGTATYSLSFPRPEPGAAAWQLDLGRVADSARVKLNGRELGVLLQAPWRIVIPADALRTNNTLEIAVTNLAANRIADLDRRGVAWKKFYNTNMPARLRENTGPDGLFSAAQWAPRASGLLGPVTLTPLQTLAPQ